MTVRECRAPPPKGAAAAAAPTPRLSGALVRLARSPSLAGRFAVTHADSTRHQDLTPMRLWSLHPKYLDTRGLVALWREALLAQAVLRGATVGYRRHPQLIRFQEQSTPVGFIADYLRAVHAESITRSYRFAADKVGAERATGQILVTRGQLDYEWQHLMEKLRVRDPQLRERLATVKRPEPHPLFKVLRGGVASWEKAPPAAEEPEQ
jgi:hypothetical protein